MLRFIATPLYLYVGCMINEITYHQYHLIPVLSNREVIPSAPVTSLGYAMPVAKDTVTRNKAKGLLESHWRPKEVARKLPICRSTAYNWEQRMQLYNGELTLPQHLRMVSLPLFLIIY